VSVYSLLAVALLWSGVDAGLSASVVVRRAAAGIAVWTLTEYLMHRDAFHFVPRTRAGVALAYLSHGVPHAYPRDPDRLVMPLIVSAPIAVMLLLAARAIGGAGAYPFLGGFALGYLAYDLIHYSIHRYVTKSGVLNWLRRYHFQHHFAATDRQFGVSTPIWDYVFRTGR
jgi:4-hydroxysphinganine ceramide fatty acyl 2-hydroxylase